MMMQTGMGESCSAEPVTVYIGLGANLGDPRRQVEQAIAELAILPHGRLLAVSPLYRTAPVGPPDQPDYINAVARIDTLLSPRGLLVALQCIERRHGRVRDGSRWGPRTLDLDILLYGDAQIDAPGLHLPHAEMHRRAFVLVPLADIAPPGLWIPGRGALGALLSGLDRSGIDPLPSAAAAGETRQAELC